MNKKKKDFMDRLSDLDDFSVEEIAKKYPALQKRTKKRILKQCIKKDILCDESDNAAEGRITISGTERYNRKSWYNFAASAAAFVIAVGGITSAFMLCRNFNGSDISVSEKPPVISCSDKNPESTSENPSVSTNNTPISLSGTNWFKHEYNGPTEKEIEFNKDGIGGYYIIYPDDVITTESTKIPFTYEQNGYDITFRMGSDDTITAKLSVDGWRAMMTLEWQDGHTESFYDYDIPITSSDNGSDNDSLGHTTESDAVHTPTTDIEPTGYAGTEAEKQKSYLEGRYFIVINNGKYDGFEFSLDGTIRSFNFYVPYGNFKSYTGETFGYELVENQFSYGAIGDEANWKTGTIIDPNDGTKFSVKFDDSVYIFSKDSSILEVENSLNGTNWYEHELNGPIENYIEFGSDGFSGHYITPSGDYTTDALKIYFTYTQNGNDITFHVGSKTATGKLSSSNNDPRGQVMMTLVWSDGLTEYLYSDDIPITSLQK